MANTQAEEKAPRRTRAWVRRLVATAAVLVTATGVALWLSVHSITSGKCPALSIEVRNPGSIQLTGVEVCVGRRCETHSSLASGESWTTQIVPLSESSVVVDYSDGNARRTDLELYVEPGWSGHLAVALGADAASIQTNNLAPPANWKNSMCAPR